MGHPQPPLAGDETATLLGSLERQRATFAWKCAGLDAAGLRTRLAPSALTLGGLLKHLALVEDDYFSRRLLGRELGAPWSAVDWDADPDWEWRTAADDTPDELAALWQETVTRSRAAVDEALVDGGLDQLARGVRPGGPVPQPRRILVDVIEEYARHVGHADLIRESIDGLVGRTRRADRPRPRVAQPDAAPGQRRGDQRVPEVVQVRQHQKRDARLLVHREQVADALGRTERPDGLARHAACFDSSRPA